MIINFSSFLIYGELKNKDFTKRNSSIYGKIKTIFLFVTLLIGYISYKIDNLQIVLVISIIVTSIFQIITAINYIIKKDDKSSK